MNKLKITHFAVVIMASAINVLFSCSVNKTTTGTETCFDLSVPTEDTLYVSDWVKPTTVIALETTDESLLGTVDKVMEFGDELYVLDKMRKGVLVFNNEGKFLRRIGRMGQGPGEYPNLSDFTIDGKNGQLYLLTNPSTIYAYAASGEFLWKKKISNSMLWNIASEEQGFVCSSNHLTYTSGEDAFLFYRFDESFQETSKEVNVYEKQFYTPLFVSSPFLNRIDGLYYVDNYFNVIYSFQEQGVVPFCRLGFKSPAPSEHFVDTNLFMAHHRENDYVMEAFFLDDFLWVSYIHVGEHYTALVDMEKNQVISNGRTKGMLPKVYSDGKTALSPLSAEEYLMFWRSLDGFLKKPVAAEDNHLILKWRIK